MADVLTLCFLAVVAAASGCDLGTIPRLPRAVTPRQYTLAVLTDPLGRHFSGNVTIEMDVVDETDNITLHSRGLTLGPALLTRQTNVEPVVVNSQQEAPGGILVVKVNQTLARGAYSLAIPFSGRLNSARQRGYYRVKTGQQETDWMSGTVFEYDHAREAFPCFDEPDMKARFRLSVAHYRNHTALSNMPVLSSEPYGEEEGWVMDHFANSPVMSSYLVAYHLIQWGSRQIKTEEGRPVSVWAPTKHLRWANNSLSVAPATLAFLKDYTGIQDPTPKLDMVLVPRFQGALENWGVVSFMPSAVLYKPNWEGELRRVLNSKVVAHELSHFWFGNLVTPRWWDALWLSEGAATFFASLILNKLEPDWDQLTEDTEEYLTTTFLSNAMSVGQPLSHPVECTQDLRSVSYAPYYKGFSLFRMLYYSLGPEKFQESIQHYLSNYQYKSATPELFYKAFDFSYQGIDLASLMHSWTYKQGLPVVSVNRTSGQLTLTQDRFILNLLGTDEDEQFKQDDVKWWVPVSLITQSQKEDLPQKQFLSPGKPVAWFSEDITLPDPAKPTEWLLLNEEAVGTYHVRYDEENLELVKASLNSSLEDIPALNRFQLVLDYGMFALAGLEPLSEVLDLLDYLENEKHFAPWSAGLRTFWRFDQRLRGTPTQHKLRERVRHLLGPEFLRLGLRSRKNDSVPTLRQRRQIAQFACLYKLPDCVKRAKRLYVKWESQTVPDKINPVPPEVRLTVYCSSVRTFGERAWNFLWERATRARDPISRDSLFTALGCTTDYTLLRSFVESKVNSSASKDVTKHDFTKVIQGLIQYNENIGPVLDFMESSMLKLKSVSKKKMRWNQNMLRDLAQQVTRPEQLKQLSNLNAMNKVWSQEETANVQRMVKHNALWREQNQNIL